MTALPAPLFLPSPSSAPAPSDTDESLSPESLPQESLPLWDLADLFPGPDSPELKQCLDQARRATASFVTDYRGKVGALDGGGLGAAIARYEDIEESLGRVMTFAFLLHAVDQNNPEKGKFLQDMRETVSDIAADLLFFGLEVNRLDEDALEEKTADPACARYTPWLRTLRLLKPHELSEDLERLLHEKHVAGQAAWVRLFDETMAALRFPFRGDSLIEAQILHLMTDKDGEVRREASESLGSVLAANMPLFTHITNTLAKDKEIEDKWRAYPHPWSCRNQANQVEDAVVDALIDAVEDSFPRLSHRYYRLKAGWFGVEALDYWDRNAPLKEEDERAIPWSQARDHVLDAYAGFSPQLADIGRCFFDSPWIDAAPRPGKTSGAFAHPCVPGVHPYLLLNYQGRVRDVMTLAHELGHGCHQYLAREQGYLMSSTPLTLSETASVFGEMLTFRALLATAPDKKTRRVMLANKVEDMLNTVVRQVAMHGFERALHTRRRKGELSTGEIDDLWLETQSHSLGPAIRFSGNYHHFWAYVPHFVHEPFYVYAYAFGDCLVNSLYTVYEESDQKDRFAEKYLTMLKAGGTQRHKDLLAPFGLDASDPAFWRRGLDVIAGFVDELEAS